MTEFLLSALVHNFATLPKELMQKGVSPIAAIRVTSIPRTKLQLDQTPWGEMTVQELEKLLNLHYLLAQSIRSTPYIWAGSDDRIVEKVSEYLERYI